MEMLVFIIICCVLVLIYIIIESCIELYKEKLSEEQKRQIKIDGERLLKSRIENADK